MTSYQKLKAKYDRLLLCVKNLEDESYSRLENTDTDWMEDETVASVYEMDWKSVRDDCARALRDIYFLDTYYEKKN